jgi:hypothetical protein
MLADIRKRRHRAPIQRLACRFNDADVVLLAATDTLHGTRSESAAPAMRT